MSKYDLQTQRYAIQLTHSCISRKCDTTSDFSLYIDHTQPLTKQYMCAHSDHASNIMECSNNAFLQRSMEQRVWRELCSVDQSCKQQSNHIGSCVCKSSLQSCS